MRLTEKSDIIEVVQWFRVGDHPAVRPKYRKSSLVGDAVCSKCNGQLLDHGNLNTGFYWQTVCPGDWIAWKRASKIPIYFRLHSDDLKENYAELKGEIFNKVSG